MLKYTSARLEIIRSYYTGIGKTTVIFAAAFLTAVSTGVVSLGIIFYAREVFHARPGQVGMLSALWSSSYIAGCLLVRPLFDRILPRHLIVISTFMMSLSFASILPMRSFAVLTLLYCLAGLSMSLFWPPLLGWLSRGMEGKRLGKVMSRYNFSWSAGGIVSPYLSGFLSEANPRYPLVAGAMLLFLTCTLVLGASLVLPRIRGDVDLETAEEGGGPAGNAEGGNRTLLRYPAWVGVSTCFVAIGIILNIFPVAARTDFGFSKWMIGLLLEGRIVSVTIGFVLMGRTHFWHFKPAPMLVCQGILALVLAMMVFAKTPPLLGALIACIGFCMAVAYFYSMFHGISGSIKRAKMMALHESLLSAGLISGSSAGGFLYQQRSMSAVYGGAALLVLAGLAAQGALSLRTVRRERKTRNGPAAAGRVR